MRVTRVRAANWRNFKTLDFPVHDRLLIVGANAAGKSNLLDLFRFAGDLVSPGGGLTSAIDRRGGFAKTRSLFARNHHGGNIVVDFTLAVDRDEWIYRLAVKSEQGGQRRPLVVEERVEKNGKVVLSRPDSSDRDDPERLTQTHLEQISANQHFRVVADHFSKVKYFHLVPQLIRNPLQAGGIEGDPHGSDFISQINSVSARTRQAWLTRIQAALQSAVPKFESLTLDVDRTGRPHLVAGYKNWRGHPARHTEADFSDGTLRLIGLLWTLVSAPAQGGLLLLEEPELSLDSAIVRTLPTVLAATQRDRSLQVALSTHAPEMLDDEGISPSEVLVLQVTGDGTTARLLGDIDEVADEVAAELPLSDIVGGLISPTDLAGLVKVGRGKRS